MTNPIDEIKNYKWTPQGDSTPSSSENDHMLGVYRYALNYLTEESKSAKGAYMNGNKVANLLRWYLFKLRVKIIHYRVGLLFLKINLRKRFKTVLDSLKIKNK